MKHEHVFSELEIRGITCDSRRVEPGYLFAALPGTQVDGRRFIADAIAKGAPAVLAAEGTEAEFEHEGICLVTHANPRKAYAIAAAHFFAVQPKTIAAVTGTNGKTSVVSFLRQIWNRLGHTAASAGTLGVRVTDRNGSHRPGLEQASSLTTPDPVDLHRNLAKLANGDVDRLAIEASSHGLDQYRLDGLKVKAAAFTNLSRDHLDYHRTAAAYGDAKRRLFSEILDDQGVAVINADDAVAGTFVQAASDRRLRILDFGRSGRNLALFATEAQPNGLSLEVRAFGKKQHVEMPLIGSFQAMNALCAAGLAIALGEDAGAVLACLSDLRGVRGRMELAGQTPRGGLVYVDYAHTPDALAHALQAIRPHARGRVHVVFGCGGDRDPGKRAEMGAMAARHADVVTITDDNPRTEDPREIRKAALVACPGAREIGDRRQAIAEAMAGMTGGDVLLVAGKGHEQGQIVGTEIIPFDDVGVVGELLGKAG